MDYVLAFWLCLLPYTSLVQYKLQPQAKFGSDGEFCPSLQCDEICLTVQPGMGQLYSCFLLFTELGIPCSVCRCQALLAYGYSSAIVVCFHFISALQRWPSYFDSHLFLLFLIFFTFVFLILYVIRNMSQNKKL
jgi:hypothetical protein